MNNRCRPDLKALETYRHRDVYGKLPCELTIMGGESDLMATEAELRKWADLSSTRPSLYVYPGELMGWTVLSRVE